MTDEMEVELIENGENRDSPFYEKKRNSYGIVYGVLLIALGSIVAFVLGAVIMWFVGSSVAPLEKSVKSERNLLGTATPVTDDVEEFLVFNEPQEIEISASLGRLRKIFKKHDDQEAKRFPPPQAYIPGSSFTGYAVVGVEVRLISQGITYMTEYVDGLAEGHVYHDGVPTEWQQRTLISMDKEKSKRFFPAVRDISYSYYTSFSNDASPSPSGGVRGILSSESSNWEFEINGNFKIQALRSGDGAMFATVIAPLSKKTYHRSANKVSAKSAVPKFLPKTAAPDVVDCYQSCFVDLYNKNGVNAFMVQSYHNYCALNICAQYNSY